MDVELHKHVREETRAWCSDGADLIVPMAATATRVYGVWGRCCRARPVCSEFTLLGVGPVLQSTTCLFAEHQWLQQHQVLVTTAGLPESVGSLPESGG